MKKIILLFILYFGLQNAFAQTKPDTPKVVYRADSLAVTIISNNSLRENFIVHSITNSVAGSKEFKEKYGIGFAVKGCMVDPFSMKTARENNNAIAAVLDDKYGTAWRKDLPATPTGMSSVK